MDFLKKKKKRTQKPFQSVTANVSWWTIYQRKHFESIQHEAAALKIRPFILRPSFCSTKKFRMQIPSSLLASMCFFFFDFLFTVKMSSFLLPKERHKKNEIRVFIALPFTHAIRQKRAWKFWRWDFVRKSSSNIPCAIFQRWMKVSN